MISLKRRLARMIERLTGTYVIHPAEIHQMPERLHLSRFLRHFNVDCIFDVGANIGQYAEMLRRDIDYRGLIISFEPIPELAAALQARASKDPCWHVEALALDREEGPGIFNIMAESVFSSLKSPNPDQPTIFTHQNAIERQITIKRSTLAVELPRLRAMFGFERPFLKMDTQGNDLAIVEGAGEAIDSFVGLQSELAVQKLYANSADFEETLAAYGARNFVLSAMVSNTPGHFPDLNEIDCIMYRKAALKP